LQPWRVLRKRVIFAEPPHIELSAEDVALPDGRVVEGYFQLNSLPSCAVVASVPDGRLIMVRQYKHGARKVCLTFPGGRMEAGEALLQTAQRELQEETGYAAQAWTQLGEFAIHANQHMGVCGLFRAKDAVRVAEPNAGDLEDMQIVLVSVAEARTALASGEIGLLGDACALGLALSQAP
jgi:ADP-ribose pyrophosphatase